MATLAQYRETQHGVRRRRTPRTSVSLLGLVAAATAAIVACPRTAHAQDVEGRIVQDVDIVGLRRVPKSAVISAIHTPVGLPYSQKVVDEDIRRLRALAKFGDDIEVLAEAVEGGIKVTFKVTESPVIEQIVFKGNRKISRKKLMRDMEIKVGDILQHHLLKLDEDHALELYHKKGYANAEVRAEASRGGTVVTFHVQENPRVYIRKILFVGNKSVKKRKLRKQIQSRRRRFFFFGGRYDREKVQADAFALQEYYREQGWLDAVAAHEVIYDARKRRITLLMRVVEGQRYRVGRIDVEGNTLFATREIRARLRLRRGKPFLAQSLRDDVAMIREIYGQQGYVESKLEYDIASDPVEPKVAVGFRIDEGTRYHVEKIKISGMQRVQDRVIRRELTIFPGDRFDTTLVKDSQRRLRNTGFFDMESADAVSIDYEPGTQANTKNVLLGVREGKVGDLRFGIGAGSNQGVFGDISVTHRNFDIFDLPTSTKDLFTGNAFVGAGHVASLRLRPGTKFQDYRVAFRNPSVFDSPYSFSTDAHYHVNYWSDWNDRRIGGHLGTGRRLRRDLTSGLTLRFDNIDISHLDADAPRDAFDVEGSHNRVGLEIALEHDKRDSRFLPAKGHIISTSLEGTVLDVKVLRGDIGAHKYFTVWDFRGWGKHILSLRTSFGAIRAYSGDVPIFERYFVGGSGSLRGFDHRGVGPVDRNTGDHIGGKYKLLAAAQYSVPLYGRYLRLHTFVDSGTTEMKASNLVSDIRAAWGFGFELMFPQLGWVPITFDFGFPFKKESTDDSEMFTFNIGSGFAF